MRWQLLRHTLSTELSDGRLTAVCARCPPQLRVNLFGQMPADAIIADRAFNTRELTNAALGFAAVESVVYDTRQPTKVIQPLGAPSSTSHRHATQP